MLPDHRQKRGAIERELGFADAVDLPHRRKRRGPAARHVEETAVGKDHVGRHGLRLCQRRALDAQRLKQRLIGLAKRRHRLVAGDLLAGRLPAWRRNSILARLRRASRPAGGTVQRP